MKKIISLFKRDYEGTRLVLDEVVPGAEWVLSGGGVATRKLDGTSCLVTMGVLFKRHEVKKGKVAPQDFRPAQEPDEVTGDVPGWVPVGDGPEDRWHREAWDPTLPDGTYELLGPKVQGNREKREKHVLARHGEEVLADAPRTHADLKTWFEARCAAGDPIEGIVWWRVPGDDACDMVKIKAKDFGVR